MKRTTKKQPSFQDMVTLFKENNYVEIGYITGIKKIYLN